MKKQQKQTTKYFKVIAGNDASMVGKVYECLKIDHQVVWLNVGSGVPFVTPLQLLTEVNANGRKIRNDKGGNRPKKTKEPELPFIGVMCRSVNDQVEEIAKEVKSNVNNPAHYGGKDNPYEAIKVIEATMTKEEFKGFLKGNVIKYSLRFDKKNGAEDLHKLSWYANLLAEVLTNKN